MVDGSGEGEESWYKVGEASSKLVSFLPQIHQPYGSPNVENRQLTAKSCYSQALVPPRVYFQVRAKVLITPRPNRVTCGFWL
jgi:hypothetical protein